MGARISKIRLRIQGEQLISLLFLIGLLYQPLYSNSDPFSTMVVSYEGSSFNALMAPANHYWNATQSNQISLEFPFYWQFVNVQFQNSKFSGKTNNGTTSPDFEEYYIAIGWTAHWQLTDRVGVQTGFSLGDHSMFFPFESVRGQKNENEFGISLECLAYLNLIHGLRLQTSYSKNKVFTTTRFDHDSILFGLGYKMKTPQFLMTFLK